jgi:hypothetical protein
MHIINWSARRSGPAMTIHGTAEIDGSKVKLTDVKLIETRGRLTVAVDGEGEEHILKALH